MDAFAEFDDKEETQRPVQYSSIRLSSTIGYKLRQTSALLSIQPIALHLPKLATAKSTN
jgi:hypothetical protein